MKHKLIQILLGAIGSVIAVLLQAHGMSAVDATVAIAGGAIANGTLGNAVADMFTTA